MEIYIKIIEVIFPVFFVIGIGYYLGKKNPKFDTNFITNFAANIGTPSMIFYNNYMFHLISNPFPQIYHHQNLQHIHYNYFL